MKKFPTQLLINFVLWRICRNFGELLVNFVQFSSITQSWPHGLQHARHPYPSPTPRDHWNSCPSSLWCHPTISSSCFQPFPASGSFPISNESAVCIRWMKYWSLSFSISPSNEYSGLISLRINWFDLFVVQGTLKSLFQHHSLKALQFLISFFTI